MLCQLVLYITNSISSCTVNDKTFEGVEALQLLKKSTFTYHSIRKNFLKIYENKVLYIVHTPGMYSAFNLIQLTIICSSLFT